MKDEVKTNNETEQDKVCPKERLVMFIFAFIYLCSISVFAWLFFSRHLPRVGIDYVTDNAFNYILGFIIAHLLFGLFYLFARITLIIGKT